MRSENSHAFLMDKIKYRLLAGCFLTIAVILKTCHCQQNTLFNQSPFQRQTPFQRQQIRQRQPLQQQQIFPTALSNLNPLNTLQPISPILPQQNIYNRNLNQLNSQNFVPITAYQNELNYDGSFSYGYSAGDGTTAQAQGYVKNLGLGEAVEAQVVQGSYSYTSPEGTPITVRYIADENGFRAEGAHIPTPPPIPDAIAKSLQYTASLQNPYQQDYSPNINPYQTPFRQFSNNLRSGQLTPLQLQQQQRFLQQQQNTGQYTPDNQFGFSPTSSLGGGTNFAPGTVNQFGNNLQSQGNFLAQQQNLTQQQQQNRQQQQLNNQQQQNQNDQQQQQQQLATQELRARPNQLVNTFGYNPYRRYKKSTTKTVGREEH